MTTETLSECSRIMSWIAFGVLGGTVLWFMYQITQLSRVMLSTTDDLGKRQLELRDDIILLSKRVSELEKHHDLS